MPHLMNCSHSDSGWCLDCVKELYDSFSGMSVEKLDMIEWLINHAEFTEWLTANAAENNYCPYCVDDRWHDQKKHNDGCEYVKMMSVVREVLLNR